MAIDGSTKSTMWLIGSLQEISSQVIFAEPVTKERAMALFKLSDYEDIVDEEKISTREVYEALPLQDDDPEVGVDDDDSE